MKKRYIALAAASLLFAMISTTTVYADEDHNHGNKAMHGDMHGNTHNPCHAAGEMNQGMKAGTFLQKKEIDGYSVSFHVMKAPEGMAKGGTHHLMVKVEKNAKAVALQAVNSKIKHPNDKSESKMMMKMGDWYMAGYDLGHDGDHQIMVLFKTDDGGKHFGGVVYNDK